MNGLMKHMQPQSLDRQRLKDFVDLLNSASTRECLAYKNSTWNSLIDWFKQVLQKSENVGLVSKYLNDELNDFLNDSNTEFTAENSSAKLAKIILILCDTNQEVVYKKVIETLVDRLINCNKYIYMSTERVEKCLFIFSFMINHLRSSFCIFIYFKL